MKKVVISQYRLLHYRVRLFELLRKRCEERGLNLALLHGQASPRERLKRDEGVIVWADKVENRFWNVGTKDILWQPMPTHLRDSDLIIVMQENRILSNYVLLISRIWSKRKVAYWGHGVNFQSDAPKGMRELWKRFLLNRVDWWFAYTEKTVQILQAARFPENRITCLNNAMDTAGFQADLSAVQFEEIKKEHNSLGIPRFAPVGLFCGSLYPDKQLEFLVAAVDQIHERVPDFHFLVIGDGPSIDEIRKAQRRRPWLHVLGKKTGHEKALYFRLAQFMLNPGSVGLHIVDAFCAGLIMLTTRDARHGPEIVYLRDGENGLITENDPVAYANAVIALIDDPTRVAQLRNQALADREKYTLEQMVDRFVDGIERCLAT